MIPSRQLVLLLVGPLGLSLLAAFDTSLLFPTVLTDAGIAFLAILDMILAVRPLVVVRREAPAVLSVGRSNPMTLHVRSNARRRLVVRVKSDLFEAAECSDLPACVELLPRSSAVLRYHVRPGRRGHFELGDLHVRYGSPLGMWIRQLSTPFATKVRVYPDVRAVRTYELLARSDREFLGLRSSRRRGGESEFERLRDYQRGDEYRAIDWKATARRQKIIAREYQIEQNQTVLFMIDAGRLMTAESSGLSLFDHALNATLMLSHVAARGGDQVGLLAFADTVKSYAAPTGGPDGARRIIQAAYDLYPALVEPSFGAAFGHLSRCVRKRALIVVFTQVVDDIAAGSLVRLARGLLPRHLPLIAMLRDVEVDGLVRGAMQGAERSSDTAPYVRGAAAEIIGFRDRLVRAMRKEGAHVLDVTPAQLTPDLVNRYLEIKARRLL